MPFEYHWTCPAIDSSIEDTKKTLNDSISSIIEDLCPLITSHRRIDLADDWADTLYCGLESFFEDVRDTNSCIRSAAETQVEELESEVDDLSDQVNSLEIELDILKNELEELRND